MAGLGSWDLNAATPFEWIFEVDALVIVDCYDGAIFKVSERYRDYDAYPMYKIRFVGPSKGLSPAVKGRLPKTFRIRRLQVAQSLLHAPEPLYALAVMGLG